MQYTSQLIVKTLLLVLTVSSGSCWQFFTSLSDIKLTNSPEVKEHLHSQYMFGDCREGTVKFYTHTHLDSMQVLGKVIVRGWLDLIRIPTCIILRGYGHEADLYRSTTYNFQMCVPRITYCHTHRRFKYYYYEWYIPLDMSGGMNWDIYFYGPPTAEWQ
ncbi:uncharacterized protein LOC118278093 [Spodoptera frugiperda]|uniref:Uncharacterized protein LOC118278093 n=2 Tax=Spodoptera frugiperda TaxID=7108 RepID=A0A9R0EQV1_SPOFR|nr:uncharacterized protein LOC118278093 [Spodoptera frugiperda]